MRRAFAAAYTRPDALRTGFGWYRAFAEDVRHNARRKRIDTPILDLRGHADGRSVRPYGLGAAGATDVGSATVGDCGELLSLERPAALVRERTEFINAVSSADA